MPKGIKGFQRGHISYAPQGKDHPNCKGGISFYKEYKNLRLKNWRHEKGISKFYIGEHKGKTPEEIKRNIRIRRKLYKYKMKKAGELTIQIVQQVYEDTIKKYGTLTCYLCELPIPFGKDHLEHKIPLSRGGTNDRENLDIACQKCNCKKHNKTEAEYRKEFSKMKTMMILILLALMVMPFAKAQEATITLKQGVLLGWESGTIKNITSVKVAETVANPNWKPWVNALWAGNVVEAGWVYDNSAADSVAIMVGRKIGTLGDYLPIKFPLADKIEITVYPIGLMANNLTDKPKFSGVSGGSYLQLKF